MIRLWRQGSIADMDVAFVIVIVFAVVTIASGAHIDIEIVLRVAIIIVFCVVIRSVHLLCELTETLLQKCSEFKNAFARIYTECRALTSIEFLMTDEYQKKKRASLLLTEGGGRQNFWSSGLRNAGIPVRLR
jgi:hypothetical protein